MAQWMYRGGDPLTVRGGKDTSGAAWVHALDMTPGMPPIKKTDRARLLRDGRLKHPVSMIAKTVAALPGVSHCQRFDTVHEVLDALMVGPVVVDTQWCAGFDTPDLQGRVAMTGAVRRRAYVVVGVRAGHRYVRIFDARGPGWGQLGRAWVPLEAFVAMWNTGSVGYQVVAASPVAPPKLARSREMVGVRESVSHG